jgi:uncharacterized protein GlcG (DUF336 family)
MKDNNIEKIVNQIFVEIETSLNQFKTSPEDWNISEGNVAICVITKEGKIFGKLYGNDKLKQRQFFNVAWKKASQTWITGYKTGDYEKIVYGGEMDPEDSLISLPDLIGWAGGQLIAINDSTELAIGFSGFRGFNDIKIVEDAVQKVLRIQ